MGIPGLTSYINSIASLWTQTDLKNTKVVIDGSSLCHYLYVDCGLDYRCGGQYEEFYNVVLSFFNSLTSKGVEPFVIFDGTTLPSSRKWDTLKERAEDRIRTSNALSKSVQDGLFLLPLLSKLVLIQALRSHSIKFAVCDGEADKEIACLASAWKCPVLSKDSDFFIFDIKAGYIPLTSLNWKSDRLTVEIYYVKELASHLRIRKELIPLWASLLGNDFVKPDLLMPFNCVLERINTPLYCSRKAARFVSVANFLCEHNDWETVEEAVNLTLETITSQSKREELRKALKYSLQEYMIADSILQPYFERDLVHSELRTQNDHNIEEWVLRKFRLALFSTKYMSCLVTGKNLLRIQVENCSETSANNCSLALRRLAYGILKSSREHVGRTNITMIQEWDREGLRVQRRNIEPYNEVELPSLRSIPGLDIEERSKFLLGALDSDTDGIRSLRDKHRLVAASLRFLISKAQPAIKASHVIALICSYIRQETDPPEDDSATFERSHLRRSQFQAFDLGAAQSFAQWQCVLREVVDLNYVLLEPLPTPLISEVYNGLLAHEMATELKKGGTPEQLLPAFNLFCKFTRIYNAVTQERLEYLTTNEMDGKRAEKKKTSSRAASVNVRGSPNNLEMLENRFALLCSHDDEV